MLYAETGALKSGGKLCRTQIIIKDIYRRSLVDLIFFDGQTVLQAIQGLLHLSKEFVFIAVGPLEHESQHKAYRTEQDTYQQDGDVVSGHWSYYLQSGDVKAGH